MLSVIVAILGQSSPSVKTYVVGGVDRRATVYAPTKKVAHPPLVFGFHGHGGNMVNAARSFQMHEEWPEAVVVYMQGLPTKTQLTDPEGKKSGWQTAQGQYGDRDLAFFDSVYRDLVKTYSVDVDRVYSMGHSNGGRFTYLLMQQRGSLFAAFGPSGSPSFVAGMTAKPVFHIAGEADPIVNFRGQSRTLDMVKKRNGCAEGKKTGKYTTLFVGKEGNDVVAYFHPGGHEYPRADAPKLIVDFFKAHKRN